MSIVTLLLSISLLMVGCGSKELEDKKEISINSGSVSSGIIIGKKLAHFELKDQFDKVHNLTNETKKIIFVFTKATGHIMKLYMGDKQPDYLTSRNITFIADISGMPSIIAKMFAIPDMQESKYPILLIKEEDNALRFRNEEQKDTVMIITLDNKIVKSVKFITNEIDLKKAID